MGRFLHHLAQLPRQLEATLAIHDGDLDRHGVASPTRPRDAHSDAYLVFLFHHAEIELRRAQEFSNRLWGNLADCALVFGDSTRHLAAYVCDFAIQITDTRLVG